MNRSRRDFVQHSLTLMASAAAAPLARAVASPRSPIRIGACVCSLAQAKQAGLDGVEVGVGDAADVLDIARPETRARYRGEMAATGLPVCSFMMGLLNDKPLATDPRGPAWLEQSIDAARDLGAKVILLAFFGAGDLLGQDGKLKQAEADEVVRRVKAAAPRAKDAGVILAIENYVDAETNARLLDRIGSDAVEIYYDVFNTGKTKGYDVPKELRLLGGRVAQIHFKNGAKYLDDDRPYFEAVATAVREIRFGGFVVLETSSPSKDVVADVKRNADFVRSLLV